MTNKRRSLYRCLLDGIFYDIVRKESKLFIGFEEGVHMTCLEAQSIITTFIEGKLEGDKLTEFIHHMRHCPDCKEELEVYYTLMVGMKQLDNNEKLSNNFAKELEDRLAYHENRIKGKKRLELETKIGLTFLITMVLTVVLFELGALVLTFQKKSYKDETINYYYVNVKPHLFYPDEYELRNPYSGIK